MDRNKTVVEYTARLIVIVCVASGTISGNMGLNVAFLLICLLAFILNSQVRIVFIKGSNKFFLLSLFVDIAVIYYIYSHFGSLTYLLLYIPMLDGILLLGIEGYITGTIIFGFLVYFLKGGSSGEIFLNVVLYLMVFIFGHHIKRLRVKVAEVESLFDQNRKYSYQLEDAKKRLEDYSKKVEHVSQLEERNRISREIHDTVGHKLTGLLMQVEATIRIWEVNPEKSREMLKSVRDNLSRCVDVLRDTVRKIKPGEYSGRIHSIKQMFDDFSRNTGVNIEFKVEGKPVKLYPSAEITLYKNAREAVTNAVRHGRAKDIWVRLEYTDSEVILTVKNDRMDSMDIVKGIGITGMEERAALLGGQVVINLEEGFEVSTVIPLR